MQHVSSPTGANNPAEQHLRAQLELLQSHDQDHHEHHEQQQDSEQHEHHEHHEHHDHILHSPDGISGGRDPRDEAVRSLNGYHDLHLASQDALRAIGKDGDSHIHPDLRASPGHPHSPSMMFPPGPPPHIHGLSMGGHPSQPGGLGPASHMQGLDENGENRPKRELSQTKRAAQNRAAQRAFRQRKEGYIKKLEQQVREYNTLDTAFKQVQSENYALREYVIHLQSRLLELEGEIPPPPPNVNLHNPPQSPSAGLIEPGPETPTSGNPLEAVAQAVAGLAAQEQLNERQNLFKPERNEEDSKSADEIHRHLHPEEAAGHA